METSLFPPPCIAGHTIPQSDATATVMKSTCTPPDFDAARLARDHGMAASLAHADQDEPGWSDRAFALLVQYAQQEPHPFTIEGFRWWAESNGLGHPPESRAYGGVTRRAIARGAIERVGYAPAASSNGSPKPLYRGLRHG